MFVILFFKDNYNRIQRLLFKQINNNNYNKINNYNYNKINNNNNNNK